MNSPLYVIMAGKWSPNAHLEIRRGARSNKTISWSALKSCETGDRVVFYVVRPYSHLLATGEVMAPAQKMHDGTYRAQIGNIELIKSGINLVQLRTFFPEWRWTKTPRGPTQVPDEIADALWKQAKNESEDIPPKTALDKKGAGFGNPETNRLVEDFAIKVVTDELVRQNYSVRSVERDKVGFDLKASKKGEELHVEVKGVSGSKIEFILTAAELAKAESDTAFRLYVVTRARQPEFKIRSFAFGAAVPRNIFRLQPLAYRAVLKA